MVRGAWCMVLEREERSMEYSRGTGERRSG